MYDQQIFPQPMRHDEAGVNLFPALKLALTGTEARMRAAGSIAKATGNVVRDVLRRHDYDR
jgi:hypothetical protein